jgi:hypothetical protein
MTTERNGFLGAMLRICGDCPPRALVALGSIPQKSRMVSGLLSGLI